MYVYNADIFPCNPNQNWQVLQKFTQITNRVEISKSN